MDRLRPGRRTGPGSGRDRRLPVSQASAALLERFGQVGAGLTVGRNRTDGIEYDADYISFSADLAVPVGWKIVLATSLSYTEYDYDNLSVFAVDPTRRDNDIVEARVSLSRPVTERLSAFLDITYTDNDSNIPAFEYDRSMVFLGLTWQF